MWIGGNRLPVVVIQSGWFELSVNRPETKLTASAAPTANVCANDAVRDSAPTASPSAANVAMPTTSVTIVAGSVRQMIWTSHMSIPMANMTMTDASERSTAPPTRPTRYIQVGTGEPSMRLSRWRSRASARLRATGGNAANMMPIRAAAGVTNCITGAPLSASTCSPASAPTMSSHASGRTKVKMSTMRLRHSSRVA